MSSGRELRGDRLSSSLVAPSKVSPLPPFLGSIQQFWSLPSARLDLIRLYPCSLSCSLTPVILTRIPSFLDGANLGTSGHV